MYPNISTVLLIMSRIIRCLLTCTNLGLHVLNYCITPEIYDEDDLYENLGMFQSRKFRCFASDPSTVVGVEVLYASLKISIFSFSLSNEKKHYAFN